MNSKWYFAAVSVIGLCGCAHHSTKNMSMRNMGARSYQRNNPPTLDQNVTSDMYRDATHPREVPFTGMVIGGNWGRVYPILHPVHRNWAPEEVVYPRGVTRANPRYWQDVNQFVGFRQYGRAPTKYFWLTLADIPWFVANTVITPGLMIIHPPLQQRNTIQPEPGLVYNGYFATSGPVMPAPQRGTVEWRYQFMKQRGFGVNRRPVPAVRRRSTLPK